VRRRIDLIAADSMLGRNTPSRTLDLTAVYVAREFRRAGLVTTVQRYPITRRKLIPARSTISIAGPGGKATLSLTQDAALMQGSIPPRPVSGGLVLLGGAVDPDRIVADSIRGKVVLWLPDMSPKGAPKLNAIAASLIKSGPALVMLATSDGSLLAGARAGQTAEQSRLEGAAGLGFTLLAVSEPALVEARPDLAATVAAVRADTGTALVSVVGTTVTATLVDTLIGRATAPNVIGVLRGAGPRADEYLALSAHMDHLGVASGAPGDSVYNGADDNGSGTVGILELAAAFARGPRPKRSLVFIVVSGEEKGLWGSGYFTEHPTVPLGRIVADVNMDMIGRNWKDTVGVIGREHSDLGQVLDSVAARHPELRMTPIGDVWPTEGRFYRSDHYNFARHGVPILFLSSGYSPDYHELTDSPDKIDAEKEARLLRLVYYFGLELANRKERPVWRPESYRAIVLR